MSCYRFLVLQMPSRTSLLAGGDYIVTKCPVSLPLGVKGLNHAEPSGGGAFCAKLC